jgi:hypothetical protein
LHQRKKPGNKTIPKLHSGHRKARNKS